MKNFYRIIRKLNFKIFSSPAIQLNRKVYDPNFTQEEKKQLRTIFRLLFNAYLVDFYKWDKEKELLEAIDKKKHFVFIDRRLKLETYVGKHFIPYMRKSAPFQHLAKNTDLRLLPDITVSDLLQMEVTINKHPLFHGEHITTEETPEIDIESTDEAHEGGDIVDRGGSDSPTKNELNEFIAQLVGLKGKDKSNFIANHKGQLLSKKNAKKVFGKDIPEITLDKVNYAKGLLELTENEKNITTQLFKLPKTTSLKDLAGNKTVDWKHLIKKGDAKKNGTIWEEVLAEAYPTTYVLSRINKVPAILTKFLKANVQLNIFAAKMGAKNQEKYNWKGITAKDRVQVIKEIRSLLRLKAITDHVRQVPQLYNGGFRSAQEIVATTRGEFIKRSGMPKKEARVVYRNAQNISNETLTALTVHLENQRNVSIPFINTPKGGVPDDVDYQEIFGALNFCECEHCNSVLSPAAYFVDLLNFIKTNNSDALDELERRRPDLWNIKLNCDQTHTTQPYLELINEVLSTYMVNIASAVPNAPDNIEDILYLPWVNPELPFEPAFLKARRLAEELDTSLFEIYRDMEVSPIVLMAEYLGLGPATLNWVIKGQALPNTSPEVYDANTFANLFNLTYDELKLIAASQLGEHIQLVAIKLDIQSYKEEVRINISNSAQRAKYLKKVFTFLRIFRHLEYEMGELDEFLSLSMVGNKEFSAAHLANFSILMYIKDNFGLSNDDIKIFVQGYSDEDIDLEDTLDKEDQLTLAKLLLQLGIDQEEFENLVVFFKEDLDFDRGQLVLKPQYVSLLKRNVLWANGAGMTIKEWLLFLELYELRPMVVKNNWQPLIAKIVQHDKVGIPVYLSEFYVKTKDNEQWYYRATSQSLLEWFESIATNGVKFIAIEDFSASVAGMLMADTDVIQILFNELIDQIYASDGEAQFIELLNSSMSESVDPEDPRFESVLGFFQLLDKNVQLLSYLKFDSASLDYVLKNASALNINRKKPFDFLAGLYHFSKWMEGLGNNLEVAQLMLIDGYDTNELTDETKAYVESHFNLEASTIKKILNLFGGGIPANLTRWNTFFNAATYCFEYRLSPEQLKVITAVDAIGKQPRIYYQEVASFFEQIVELSGFSEDKKEEITDAVGDQLLEAKRDAIVALLKKSIHIDFSNTSKIYEFFLLDVEMSACADVSPIKAAILSVQLFIQRCLMNLEEAEGGAKLRFDDDDKKEWEWRKNYRVWEVNRKIFLYPENYLDPSLRDDKTPIYEELEGDLQQRDLTHDSIKHTYNKYLKEFAVVGKLAMAGNFYDEYNNLYYYFGRTPAEPYLYYYKTYHKPTRKWSHWYPIDVNIDSYYLSGATAYGKLYIFWLAFKRFSKSTFFEGTMSESNFYKPVIKYSSLSEDGSWASPVQIDLDQVGIEEWIIDGYGDFLFNKFLHVKKVDKKFLLTLISDINFGIIGPSGTEEVLVEISIPEDSILGQPEEIPEYSVAGICALTTHEGIELVAPGLSSSEMNLSEHQIINVALLYGGADSVTDPIITSSKALTLMNGQSLNTYTIKNEEKNYQYLFGNDGLFPMNSFVVNELSEKIFIGGLDEFLKPDTQINVTETTDLVIHYDVPLGPNNLFMPDSGLDFEGPNGIYFKELYFHIPFALAKHFNLHQKFEEADYWFKKIFDPTVEYESDEKYWQYTPFRYDMSERMKAVLQDTVALDKYHKDPFNPHAIARLRTSAYPKAVVMSYIDNLLDWGDSLFRQDTYESINEAMMLYIIAQQLLGDRPQGIAACETANQNITFREVEEFLTRNNEVLIEVETLLSENKIVTITSTNQEKTYANNTVAGKDLPKSKSDPEKLPYHDQSLMKSVMEELFCIPWNETLMQYWDTVEDRMFKIRNCLNIDGEYRQLALFEPPIDPMMLIRARGSGISLSALTSKEQVHPYRFNYLLDKAKSYIQTVQGFGQVLLATLEKENGEALNELRVIHESNVLQLMEFSKEKQIEEIEYNRLILEIEKEKLENNVTHFQGLISGKGTVAYDIVDKAFKKSSGIIKSTQGLSLLTSILYLVPQLGAPTAMTFGGKNTGDSAKSGLKALHSLGMYLNMSAEIMEKYQNYNIRNMGWKQQLATNEKDLENNENQRSINELKMAISERDLEIHEQNVVQNQEVLDFYAEKMTNEALYNLMAGHLSRLFRDAYGLAFQTALDAQTAYRFEMNDDTASFVAYDNWDTATMGLLSSEKLQYQLMQMETSYLEKNTRKAEIRSHVSLAMLDPNALLELIATGNCTFAIPETWFDIQYPGQYRRRIKSVSLTIPCVVGPYVNVACKLKLTTSKLRPNPSLSEPLIAAPKIPKGNDRIFTSTAQNDAGVLEFNFRDERYLPFEGSGVDSEWELKLPKNMRSFDYNTISDVLIHINYTAEYDEAFGTDVEDEIATQLNEINSNDGLFKIVSLKHEFPNEWYQASTSNEPMSLVLKQEHFPFFAKANNLQVTASMLKETDIAENEIVEHPNKVIQGTGGLPLTVELQLDEEDFEKELFLVVQYTI